MTRAGLRLAIVTLAASTAAAGSAATEFRIVAGSRIETLERDLNAAGRQGFRLLAADEGPDVSGRSRVVVLLKRAPDRTFDFAVLESDGNLSDAEMRRALEERTSRGYRLPAAGILARRKPAFWLPESTYDDQSVWILERFDPSARYEYVGVGFRNSESFRRELADRRTEGFEVLGLKNTGRKLQVVMERNRERPATGPVTTDEYRLLLIATRRVLKAKVNGAANAGYRLIATEDPPTAGPPMLLMRKSEDPVPIDYRFTKNVPGRMRKGKLERKLDKRARKGWRVVPGGITDAVLTLERRPARAASGRRAEYRVVSSGQLDGLPESLTRATADGFRFVRLFAEPSRTTVLLERSD